MDSYNDIWKLVLGELSKKYSDERRTEISAVSGEVDIEDLIPEEMSVRSAPQPTTVSAAPPAPKAPPAPQLAAAGDSAIWSQLIDQYKGRLPIPQRVFLNMATGVLNRVLGLLS